MYFEVNLKGTKMEADETLSEVIVFCLIMKIVLKLCFNHQLWGQDHHFTGMTYSSEGNTNAFKEKKLQQSAKNN